MHEYELPLLRYATNIIKDSEQAKDTVQETFIRLVKEFEKGSDLQNIKAWLYRVCHNLSLDYLRKASRKSDCLDSVLPTKKDESLRSPSDELRHQEECQMVLDSVDQLNERERKILMMKVREGRSYKEIAEELDLTVNNVGFILHQTMKKLAEIFKHKADGAN